MSAADLLALQQSGGNEVVKNRMLVLQRSAGNQMVNRMLVPETAVVARQEAPAAVDHQQLADDYEADAMAYWEENMRMELEAAAGAEGTAIGRRAGVTAASEVRKTCEPYEEDQETDTQVLNTIFAITGGALTISEGQTSGTSGTAAGKGANLASRAVRSAMALVWMWMPTLAGYKTVGALKAAASRQAEESGAQAGEGGSKTFAEYQEEALKALHDEFKESVDKQKRIIVADKVDEAGVRLAKSMFAAWRSAYMTKLRKEYGASSPVGTAVQEAVVKSMAPKMAELKKHLDEAKEKRQSAQQTTGIIGGIVGGAVTGAVIGGVATSWTGPGALIGAGIGAVVGGIIGGVGAAIMSD